MKIAITGGAGFIGARLTKAYLDAGHDVLVIDSLVHGSRKAIDGRARFYQVDIRDGRLRTILHQERPDMLSHHAEQQHRGQPGEQSLADADVHVRGLLNVLNGCVDAAVKKVIFASGGNTLFGSPEAEHLPLREDVALCPLRALDISKGAGEWYVRYYTRQYGLKHTILRYADVYGMCEEIVARVENGECLTFRHPLHYFIAMLSQQRRPIIRGTGEEARDHIFLDDVVQANLYALKRGDNQTLHISSGRGYTQNQLYQTVALLMESQLTPVYLSGPLPETFAVVLDNSLAQRVLGWSPAVALTEGVQRLLTSMKGPSSANKGEPLLSAGHVG